MLKSVKSPGPAELVSSEKPQKAHNNIQTTFKIVILKILPILFYYDESLRNMDKTVTPFQDVQDCMMGDNYTN